MSQRYPLPITPDMLLPANENAGRPYYTAEVLGRTVNPAADWHGGQPGNEADQAEAMQVVGTSASAVTGEDYDPQHQEAKAKDMVPQREILSDLGKDYGLFGGQPYRDGTITPRTPYPTATE